MKKTSILFIIGMLLAGCATNRPTAQESVMYPTGYNFTEYTAKGFLFTPEGYTGDYESVGLIWINYQPRFIYLPDPDVPRITGYRVYKEPGVSHWWRVSYPDPAEMIDQAYNLAMEMGADAIINFEIASTPYTNGTLTVSSSYLTGFAIRRK